MDPCLALEQMAENALTSNDADTALSDPSNNLTQRWHQHFEYSHSEAVERVKKHRSDLNRCRVSDEYWSHVKTQYEDQGFDREAFEYSLSTLVSRSVSCKDGLLKFVNVLACLHDFRSWQFSLSPWLNNANTAFGVDQ